MNVCLISSASSGVDFQSPVLEALTGLGFRVVVLFLRPQTRRAWSRGSTIFVSAYPSIDFHGEPLAVAFRRALDQARDAWREPIKDRPGDAFRIVRGLERRGYLVARFAGMQVFSRVDGLVSKGYNLMQARILAQDPLSKLPKGPSAFAVFHALDHEAVPVAKEACERSGARFLGPDASGLREKYEAAIMHWLQV